MTDILLLHNNATVRRETSDQWHVACMEITTKAIVVIKNANRCSVTSMSTCTLLSFIKKEIEWVGENATLDIVIQKGCFPESCTHAAEYIREHYPQIQSSCGKCYTSQSPRLVIFGSTNAPIHAIDPAYPTFTITKCDGVVIKRSNSDTPSNWSLASISHDRMMTIIKQPKPISPNLYKIMNYHDFQMGKWCEDLKDLLCIRRQPVMLLSGSQICDAHHNMTEGLTHLLSCSSYEELCKHIPKQPNHTFLLVSTEYHHREVWRLVQLIRENLPKMPIKTQPSAEGMRQKSV
ncbi:MAG: hypothetical protein VXW87_00420 [Pseudomonadota bacterium]|nr:hypothetical protein [Pseudomonadota bacterium]